jgi:hypothetical protein
MAIWPLDEAWFPDDDDEEEEDDNRAQLVTTEKNRKKDYQKNTHEDDKEKVGDYGKQTLQRCYVGSVYEEINHSYKRGDNQSDSPFVCHIQIIAQLGEDRWSAMAN